ncbi:MAG TPA: SurA N-terminal domain-containing protein [Candidatus Cloacimonadota bacterium]|nr:SurA N-terminal domain-containing protein [Candidatus Cloacimonadota bacterium]
MFKRLCFTIMVSALLLGACQVNNTNTAVAGVINGRKISYPEYMEAYRAQYENYYTRTGKAPESAEKKQLEQQTWANFTKRIILDEQFRKYEIRVTHEEVVDTLAKNPPDYILKSPLFQTNGKFDSSLYIQSLRFDSPENLKPIRKHYYDTVIPIQKLKDKLIDKEFLNSKRVKLISRIMNGSADIDWLVFEVEKASIRVNDAFIEEYYQANLQNYMLDPYLSIKYARIKTSPSADDVLHSKLVADSVMTNLTSGIDLEQIMSSQLAKREALELTDTGFLFLPDLSSEMKEAVYGLEAGQFTPVISSPEGYSIYQVAQITKSMIKLRKLFIPNLARGRSIAAAEATANNFMELAKQIGMDQACYEMDLEAKTQTRVKPGAALSGDESLDAQLILLLNEAKAGTILKPIFSSLSSAWYVVQITEKQTKSPRPLDEIRDEIARDYLTDKKQEYTLQQARIMADKLKSGGSFGQSNDYSVLSLRQQKITDQILGRNIDTIYFKSLTGYLQKEQVKIYELPGIYLIPVVKAHYHQTSHTISRTAIRDLYVRSLDGNWFDVWMNEQLAKANTKIMTTNQ